MVQSKYNEAIEARSFVRGATQFRTTDERAVFDAIHARAVRDKARTGLNMPSRREYWENELASVQGSLSIDDPLVVAALADGETAFYHRVWDRIWQEHQSEIDVPRCMNCNSILKTFRAQQCLWCGHDWH